ncbi:hypothetical protein LTR64_001305 [Lithohypha guttulata]|uniref:uncharacterized protein n=1 Tax=Lithohypha guttulata TaxID=1690604 RepID=UPI002DDFEDCB|nr:hypothetical protein LTR51_003499 [Lithohypha guttulata]
MASDDRPARVSPVPPPVESIEVDEQPKVKEDAAVEEAVAEGERGGEGSDNDAPGEVDDEMVDVTDLVSDGKVSNDLYKEFKAITEVLLEYKVKSKNNEEHLPSSLFKRLPNKRLLPDYYEVIKEPSAISTLRGKIQRKQYSGVPEFVRDFALIVHNAQLYNRPNSQPVRDVLKLDELFKAELQRLVAQGYATEEDAKYPDLGEIPYASPEPDPITEEDDIDDDDEDDDEDADESDDDKRKRKGRRGTRPTGKKGEEEEDDEKGGDAEQKRRGRPPKVATPMEHRIDRILKSLKKLKAQDGVAMISPFERLPDKSELPDYYQVIKEPMAYDTLKKKAKRKKYQSIAEFMKDVELMFKNALMYNEDGSDIHKWAQELLDEAKRLETEELAKPDSEYLLAADGRIPLQQITYKNDTWKVGDWIHIQNPNDITKPIVAQIYRTWKTASEEEWINACWYYRPDQTVHQYEKHFYPNEVVKTGQYRDHKIDEVLNKCFVMFYTRYSRGRPRNLPPDTEVYVCEARYNEDKFKFNKIKTWASCLPDEVRDKDYEMDLFDTPRKIKKVPSPLLSRLKEDAKSTDELPQPEWNHANAPPLVGGIHKRPRDENQSPPPEPTPPAQPAPPPVLRTPSINRTDSAKISNHPHANSSTNIQMQHVRPAPSMTPQASFNTTNANPYSRQPSFSATPQAYITQSQNGSREQSQPQQHQYTPQPAQPTPLLAAAQPGNHGITTPNPAFNRPAPSVVQPVQYHVQQAIGASHQRTADTYVLSDAANASIPSEIRSQFPRDDQGRVLFFTTPPLDTRHVVTGSSSHETSRPLEHTADFTQAILAKKRKLQASNMSDVFMQDENVAKRRQPEVGAEQEQSRERLLERGINVLTDQMKHAIYKEHEGQYGNEWRATLLADTNLAQEHYKKALQEAKVKEERRKAFTTAHLERSNVQYGINSQGYITGWQKDFFTGTYLDDWDARLP